MTHLTMAPSARPAPTDVSDLLRRGREALAARRYGEARDLFDEALRVAPEDPQVQSLAVTAEFWRRLARDGDGFPSIDRPGRGPG
jgi:Flp pilus assembly protein TadD